MTRLTWEQVNGWRLMRQMLTARTTADLPTVASQLCGLHAQVMQSAEQQVWARVAGCTAADLAAALWEHRTLLKLWAMRGTLHMLATHDYPVYLAAFGSYNYTPPRAWQRSYGITGDALTALLNAVPAVLDGTGKTRSAIAPAVAALLGQPDYATLPRAAWEAPLKTATYRGQACFAPSQGVETAFARPDAWIAPWQPVAQRAALLAVAERYLATYAPATYADFARWFGCNKTTARSLFAALDLAPVQVDDWRAFVLPATLDALRAAPPPHVVRLLPYYDPYTVAVGLHADYIMDGEQRKRVYRSAAVIAPVVLVDGRIEGVWVAKKERGTLHVTVDLFCPADADARVRDAIAAEVASLGAFLAAPADVRYAAIDAR